MTGSKRYLVLDGIRGFAFLNMVIYHAVWDCVYLFGFDWQWYQSEGAYIWQQYICWTFILLSGFCQPLGQKKLKRGICVLLAGFMISAVTWIVMPEACVRFGILTLIGSCMLLMIPMERFLKKCSPPAGAIISLVLFILTRNINSGHLGFGEWNLLELPSGLYQNLATAYLGFPGPEFSSTDYFSLLPWGFLFVFGYFLYQLFAQREWLRHLEPGRLKPLEWLGRHTLGLYLIHQPVLYLLLFLLFSQ